MQQLELLKSVRVHILIDETWMAVYDPPPEMLKELKFVEQSIVAEENEKGRTQRKKKRKTRYLYTAINKSKRVFKMLQGLEEFVVDWLTDQGITYQIHDMRTPFREANLDLMHGLRYSQRDLLEKALKRQRSGLIGAPTRYGKTFIILNTLRAFRGHTSAILLPGADLIRQLTTELREHLEPEGREVKRIGGGSGSAKIPSKDITVCSMDSMHKLDAGYLDLIGVDEPHALPTDKRIEQFLRFDRCRKYGYSATLGGRFDKRDRLIEALIGPKLAVRTFREAVEEGAICDIVVLMIRIPPPGIQIPEIAVKLGYHLNRRIASAIREVIGNVIPPDWQTLLFIENEEQADFLVDYLPEGTELAMAKKMTTKERRDLFDRMVEGSITQCMSTKIYEQGVTFPELRVIINAKGGGPYTSAIQRPGRLAQNRPGKRCGVMVDFQFDIPENPMSVAAQVSPGDWPLIQMANARRDCYEAIGYRIYDVRSVGEFKRTFIEHCV